MKKKERYFILSIPFFAILLWICMALFRPHNYGSILIEAGGKEYGIYSLSRDQVIEIGSSNICEIKDGRVRMIYADCPDQLCIKQGSIDSSGGMIVCLPNKVIIKGEKTESPGGTTFDADAVS